MVFGREGGREGGGGVFGVFGVHGVGCRLNFEFGLTKTTRNVTWGSILTPCRKMLKTTKN